MNFEAIIVGELQTNCYIVWNNDKESLIIDPGDDGIGISELIQTKQLTPKMVLATHGHYDHVLGALDLKLVFNIPFGCSEKDSFLLERQDKTVKYFSNNKREISPNFVKIDLNLETVELIKLGNDELMVIKTPGHTPGGVCFYSRKDGLLFSGDTLFAKLRGRTDLSYSSTKDIFKSLKSLMELPEDTIVLPGHGEETSIGREKTRYKFE